MAKLKVNFEPATRNFDWFVQRLDLDGARRNGTRDVVCRCPAHDDFNPSLHVWEDKVGFQVHCFAGCTRNEIEEALQDADPTDKPVLQRIYQLPDWRKRGKPIATYVYCDKRGKPLFRKQRFEWSDGSRSFVRRRVKDFSVQRAVKRPAQRIGPPEWLKPHWGWEYGLKDRIGAYLVEPVPYKLPELIAGIKRGETIWVADGEKDVDRLTAEGIVATCAIHGMKSWSSLRFNEYLRGADSVVVVADRDRGGLDKSAFAIAESLREMAIPARVVAAKVGKDAFDHLEAGKRIESFEEVTLD